jgi:hypothetical protein
MAGQGSSMVEVGRTSHFVFSYEALLGARGRELARGALRLCERDYRRVQFWFGRIEPPRLPFECRVVNGNDGASHSGCHGTTIFLDAFDDSMVDPRVIAWGNVAEIVEVFCAAQGQGWDCGYSNGEGLSRVLATARYPRQLDGYETAADWLDSTRRNFVDHNATTDLSRVSTGCAVLFLNYLHHQLGYSWRDIVTSGRPTLGATHQALTGTRSSGWQKFERLVSRHYPRGARSSVRGDNIFPLAR